jgi:hypothetical protein
MEDRIIVLADKTVLRVAGLTVRGLKPPELEKALADRLGTPVRVIGVTGRSVDMDVYGMEPEAVLADEEGAISAISAVEGITASEVTHMASARRAVDVDLERLPRPMPADGCRAERWRRGNER